MTARYDLSQRLSPEDHLEVLNLFAHYNHVVDFADFDGWAECYVDGGALAVPTQGVEYRAPDELIEFGTRWIGRNRGFERHVTTNVAVYGAEDDAWARSYVLMCVGGSGGAAPTMIASGRYEDALRRTPLGWRFVRRVLTFDEP